jgi:hypothetical protein
MTTLYTSNDPLAGFDATAPGAMPSGWAALSGSWAVGTSNPCNGHARAFACNSALDGQVALLSGVAAVVDMELVLSQRNFGTSPFMGGVIRADAGFANGYVVAGFGTGPTALGWMLFKRVAGAFSIVASGSSTLASGTLPIRSRLRAVGSTIQGRFWSDGTAEPVGWAFAVSDGSVTAAGYAGLYNGENSGTSNGAVVSVTDLVLQSAGPSAITVDTPAAQVAGAAFTVTGTYSGAAPGGMEARFDNAGAYVAASGFSASGGAWSATVAAPSAAGLHVLGVRTADAVAVTSESAAFTVGAAPAVGVAGDDPALLYSPYNWNLGAGRATTINAGAAMRTLFSGGRCTLNFDTANLLPPLPQIWYRIDGVGPWTQAELAASVECVIPAATLGNADIPLHLLELVVKATTETRNRWNAPSATAIALTGLTLAAGAVVLAPQAAPLNLLVYGDSITEGVRALGEAAAADTDRNDAMQGWAFRLGALLGAEVGVVGFGGSGLSVTGSGNVPPLAASYALLSQGMARRFVPAPDMVVLNIGTNDGGANTVSGMIAVLNGIVAACPGAVIAVIRPFNGSQAANLQAAIAGCSNPQACRYVDSTGVFDTARGSDSLGLHPSAANNLGLIAPALAARLRGLLGGSLRPPFRGGFQRGLLG